MLDALRRGHGGYQVTPGLWHRLDVVVWMDLDDRPGWVHGLPLLLSTILSGRAHAAFPGVALSGKNATGNAAIGAVRRAYDTWALRPLGGSEAPLSWPCDSMETRAVPAFKKLEREIFYVARRYQARWLGFENRTIEVASAFNGIGAYLKRSIGDCRYVADGDCEHIAFHRCMRERNGARLAVLPAVSVGAKAGRIVNR